MGICESFENHSFGNKLFKLHSNERVNSQFIQFIENAELSHHNNTSCFNNQKCCELINENQFGKIHIQIKNHEIFNFVLRFRGMNIYS